jgi:AcrR family transcriptional regulator
MENKPKKRLTREEAKQLTRKNLLEAASAIFAEKGFHGASIDDVAEAAGYTKGAVYAHFDSKDDLYLALLDENLDQESHIWTRIIEEGKFTSVFSKDIETEILDQLNKQQNWGILSLEFFVYAMRNPQVKEKLALKVQKGIDDYQVSLQKRYENNGLQPSMPISDLAKALLILDNGFSMLGLISGPNKFVSLYTALISRLLD